MTNREPMRADAFLAGSRVRASEVVDPSERERNHEVDVVGRSRLPLERTRQAAAEEVFGAHRC